MTTPDPATLREALDWLGEEVEDIHPRAIVAAAARWALDLIEGGKEVWWCVVGEKDNCGLVRGPAQEWCEFARGQVSKSKLVTAHAECGKRLLVVL